MINDDKAVLAQQGSSQTPQGPPPPAYGQSPNDKGPTGAYGAHPPQTYVSPQPQQYPSESFFPPQGAGSSGTPGEPMYPQYTAGGSPWYPPPQVVVQQPPAVLSAGAQYQQQLFAMCAAGNHDIQKKHGIAGIIGAIVFFPIGLLCLMADTEKRCVRCGARVG
ncbi:hypothetical protein C2E23DRAFT_226091 [Lenzites betulinus]|nr:hypothetical protein C2E23DRAFT_226091 [Lenzites betulinus]